MNNTIKKCFSILFCAVLVLGFASYIFISPRAFSEKENRTLAGPPQLGAESLGSNVLATEFENYANDQFIWRDFAVSIKANLEKLSGKQENNGIYFAADNYLIEKPASTSTDIAKANIEAIKKVAGTGKYDVSLMLVPTAFEVLKDKLPEHTYNTIQRDVAQLAKDTLDGSGAKFIDPTDELYEHKDEYIYFRNDHHQTAFGSYLAYKVWCDANGVEAYSEQDFVKKDLSDAFYGTTWSRSSVTDAVGDTVSIYEPKFDISYEVNYVVDNKTADSMYEMSWIDKKDKYSVFFDGNHPIVTINTSNKNGKKIAVFKDSYANSILPLLVNHYESVHVIDLRYYSVNPLMYLDSNGITEMLVLYNTANFVTDTNAVKLGAFIK